MIIVQVAVGFLSFFSCAVCLLCFAILLTLQAYIESSDQLPDGVKFYVWTGSEMVELWDASSPTMFEALHAWDEILEPHGKAAFKAFKAERERLPAADTEGMSADVLPDRSFGDLLDSAGISAAACGILRAVISQTNGARLDCCSAALEYQAEELWMYDDQVFRLVKVERRVSGLRDKYTHTCTYTP